MKKSINTFSGLPGRFSVALIISLLLSANVFAQVDNARETIQKFSTALQLIEFAYVDSTDPPKLVEKAIIAMLKNLDPHSAYISRDDVQKVNEPLEAEFEGIGVTFQLFNDTILVISPVPGGPSDKLGILAGDKILKINGEDAFGSKVNNEYVMDRLRGKKGTSVDVSILRSGRDNLLEFTIIRDKIPLNSIDATYMVAPQIGYIKLTRFAKSSMSEFHESIAQLREQGMKDLILDLRSNSGGFLNVAVELSDQFLPDKKLIVYTKGLRSPRQEFLSTMNGDLTQGKLIVLINEGSASASEIVSGAVQDWDRGLIVGRRSFGKGLVQRPFNLPDGSLIRLTTARYFTPTGRCIQKPYDEGAEEYYKDLKNRLDNGELVDAKTISFPDSLKYFTPKGRIVYGGGGIMPDVFVPLDSTRFSDYYSDLVRTGIFNTFTLNYLEKNRNKLVEKYPDFEAFDKNFKVTTEMFDDFLALALEKKVERKADDKYFYPVADLKTQVKAMIARNLWDTNAYFRIINPLDKELKVAVDLIQDGSMFTDLKLH
ncbi:MAG: S41 family peptidase [Sphingobacteriia bacterium]|nr:S41 family peptidase [Sphingobacteriia bacterium]